MTGFPKIARLMENIPKRRNILYSVAKRAIQGDPLLPLTQKQNAKNQHWQSLSKVSQKNNG